jgi:hypothetical protein
VFPPAAEGEKAGQPHRYVAEIIAKPGIDASADRLQYLATDGITGKHSGANAASVR